MNVPRTRFRWQFSLRWGFVGMLAAALGLTVFVRLEARKRRSDRAEKRLNESENIRVVDPRRESPGAPAESWSERYFAHSYSVTCQGHALSSEALPELKHLHELKSLFISGFPTPSEWQQLADIETIEELTVSTPTWARGTTPQTLASLATWKSLRRLELSCRWDPFEGGWKAWQGNRQLESLHLTFADFQDSEFPTLLGLRELEITDSILEDRALGTFRKLSGLEELRIESTHFKGESSLGLDGLTCCQVVLQGCLVDDAGIQQLSTVPNLEELEVLGKGVITDASLRELSHCRKLRRLVLGSNHITEEGVVQLKQIATLEDLQIVSDQVSKTIATRLVPPSGKLKVSVAPWSP